MNVYFDMEDIVGNLLIILKSNGYDVDNVSYGLITEYCIILRDSLISKGINPIFRLSRNDTQEFLLRNRNMYTEDGNNIKMIKKITLEELIDMYQGYLGLEVIKTMYHENLINKVINAYHMELEEKKVRRKKNEQKGKRISIN